MGASRARLWLRYAFGAALIILAAFALLAWAAGREATLQWLAAETAARTNGALTLEGVRGSLYGPLAADRVVWDDMDRRFEARGVQLDWSPSALLRGRVLISALETARLDLLTKRTSDATPQLPDKLALPVSVYVPQLRIGEVVMRTPQRADTVRNVAASLELGPREHVIAVERLTTEWGTLTAHASIGTDAPFPVAADAQFAGDKTPNAYHARAALVGSLSRIEVMASAGLGSATAKLQVALAPFAIQPLVAASIEAGNVEPAALHAGLPAARLSALVEVRGTDAGAYAGTVTVKNAQAGRLDEQRLPLVALSYSFSGTLDEVGLKDVWIDLGAAGAFAGTGRLVNKRLELALATERLDLQGIQRSLHPTRLAGSIRLGVAEDTQTFLAELAQENLLLRLDAALGGGRLQVREASAHSGEGTLSVRGELALAAPRAFSAQGQLERIDLSAFGTFPASAINGSFRARGSLDPRPAAELELDVHDSHLRGYALAASARAQVAPARAQHAVVKVTLAGNRLELTGDYGAPGDRLEFMVTAPHLDRIGYGLKGRVEGRGFLQGLIAAPAAGFSLRGQNVVLPGGHALTALQADGQLARGLAGKISLNVTARGLRSGNWRVERATLSASGTQEQHSLELQATGPQLDASIAASGGWREGTGWSGILTRLEQQGPLAVRLEQPARVMVGGDGFSLTNLGLRVGAARVRIDSLARSPARAASRGEVSGLPLAMLQPLLKLPEAVRSTLIFGGRWDLEKIAPAHWRGSIAMKRESGDVELSGVEPVTLGLTRLALETSIGNGTIASTATVKGSQLGTVEAEARLPLAPGEVPSISADAPLAASLRVDTPSIAWLAGLSKADIALKGALRADLSASGTLAAPQFHGTVTGKGLALQSIEQGVQLTGGELRAELSGGNILLRRLNVRAGDGSFEASGRLRLAGADPDGALDWKATQLEAVRRPDRLIVLSGAGAVELKSRRLAVSGKLSVDRGLIELAELSGVTVSDDVVVKGRKRDSETGSPLRVGLDLALDLGKRFYLKGLGIDARLEGDMRLRAGEDQLPMATGRISVAEGRYSAYGQRLVIERGIISFIGPIDNPGLDVIALRKNQEVVAGVAVTGTAVAPSVKLVSQPDVPDTAKLSWLVLGRGPETATGGDLALLSTAASALLSKGESATLQGKIEEATGLDEFGFRTGSTVASSVVTLGKRLSSNAYLVYEQGLAAAASIVKLRYTLTPRLTVQTQAGTETAVDLFYNFYFD